MIEGILIGLTTALTFQNILMVMVGCFFGTIIGMLPGLGPMTAIALMIPITYGFDPATGLILMAGVYYGAVFGGSYFFYIIKCTRCSRNCSNFI
jgi:putative tricarboxylic transport membrane protein